jgi:predicted enzyme related to lactoylglutathione lyase
MAADGDREPHWHVTFAVHDRDATAAATERLGGAVLTRGDTEWTRDALVRDPQGAVFTVSQFAPPG